MSRRIFYRLVLAFALAFAGSSAQLHALAHAQSDLVAAGQDHKAPAPLKHATDQCLVIHALDGTAAEPDPVHTAEVSTQTVAARIEIRASESPAAAYWSRAPPLLT
jgi:hypothetical protein